MNRTATRQALDETREPEPDTCTMILSAEEWQLLVTAAALAGPDVSVDELARDLLVRTARQALAADDDLH